MSLARPELLWLLIVLVPLAVLALWAAQRAPGWRKLTRSDRPPSDGTLTTGLVCVLLTVALSRPAGPGRVFDELVRGRDLVLVIDVSRSMGAEDVLPTRLGMALELARGVLAGLGRSPHDRAAVVAFAGRGVVRCPLTENLGAARAAVDWLVPDGVRPGGSDLAAGVEQGLEVLGDVPELSTGRAIVVISDGEDHRGAWRAVAEACREKRVIVHALAVGDAEVGAPVPPSVSPTRGAARSTRGASVEDVITRRQDEPMRELAHATGGAFVPVGTRSLDARELFRTVVEPVEARVRWQRGWTSRTELFGWFALPALVLLVLSGLSWRSLARPRVLAWGLVLAVTVGSGGATPADDPGLTAFRASRFDQALAYYEAAQRRAPSDPRLLYNAGEALFQLGRYEEAMRYYQRALPRATGLLRMKAEYAAANALVALGRPIDAIALYEACIASRVAGVEAERLRDDAHANLAFARQLLEPDPEPPDGQASEPPEPTPEARTPPPQDREREQSPANGKQAEPDRTSHAPGEGESATSGSMGRAGGGGGSAMGTSTRPEARLESALQRIEAARGARLEPPSTSTPSETGLPDW